MTREELTRQIEMREGEILSKKMYLRSKDYQTIREMQGGEPMSADVKKACADARRAINALQGEIDALKEELEKCREEPRMEEEEPEK